MKNCLLLLSLFMLRPTAPAQGTVPTFVHQAGGAAYTLVGRDPATPGTTTIPTVLVPITLVFAGKSVRMFWTINDDRREGYNYSNRIGPQLHGYPASR